MVWHRHRRGEAYLPYLPLVGNGSSLMPAYLTYRKVEARLGAYLTYHQGRLGEACECVPTKPMPTKPMPTLLTSAYLSYLAYLPSLGSVEPGEEGKAGW